MCNFIQRPWHSCESHAWDIMNLTPARVTQLWIGRSHDTRSPDGSSPPGLLWCQLSQATDGVPQPVSPSPPQLLLHCQWNMTIQHQRARPGRSILAVSGCGLGSTGGLRGRGNRGQARQGEAQLPSSLASPSPVPGTCPVLWSPNELPRSQSPSSALGCCAALPAHQRWGHVAAQLGIMTLLPRWASSMANACCKKPAG